MSDERANGFYWVKTRAGEPWEVAGFFGGIWQITGNECDFYDPHSKRWRELHEIGPYIGTEPQDTGWRDIASAPKDGTDILLCYRREDVARIFPPVIIAFWSNKIGAWVKQGGAASSYGCEPTHWMPVPAAPQMKESKE